MDVGHFNRLVTLMSCRNACMEEATPPAERVALTLRFLASGESFHCSISLLSLGFVFEEYLIPQTWCFFTKIILQLTDILVGFDWIFETRKVQSSRCGHRLLYRALVPEATKARLQPFSFTASST